MKIKMVQFDTRNKEWFDIGIEVNKKYCEINGYDYESEIFKYNLEDYKDVTEFTVSDKAFKNMSVKDFMIITYHKFELVEKYLNDYDYVVFADSDCIINNPNKKIENLLDDQHDFYISLDGTPYNVTLYLSLIANEYFKYCKENNKNYIENFYEFSKNRGPVLWNFTLINMLGSIFTNPNGINSGFFIVKNSSIMKEFISDCKKYHKLFYNAIYDQGCIGHLMTTDKYKNVYKIFEKKFQGDNLAIHPDFQYDENENFINHMPGGTDQNRIDGMNLVKNNKWWKKYF